LWILIGIGASEILILFKRLLISQIIFKDNVEGVTCRVKLEFSL